MTHSHGHQNHRHNRPASPNPRPSRRTWTLRRVLVWTERGGGTGTPWGAPPSTLQVEEG